MSWNWKIGVTLAVLVGVAMLAYGDTNTIVRFVVPSDLSFTVTVTAGTYIILFNSSGPTIPDINASNQTSTNPVLNFTNTGNTNEYFNIKLDYAAPTGVVMKCGPAFGSWQASCECQAGGAQAYANSTACCNITTTNVKVNNSATAVGGSQPLWCWANFSSVTAGTYDRNLTSNASTS